jgi:hypothetical protein
MASNRHRHTYTNQILLTYLSIFIRVQNKWNYVASSKERHRWNRWRPRFNCDQNKFHLPVESSWNVMAHGDAREGKWRGNRRMEWVASTLHTTSEHGLSSITTADTHTSAASSRLNWRPRRFKWTRPFRRKTKSGFCACAITFQTQSTGKTGGLKGYRGGVGVLEKRKIPCTRRSSKSGSSSPWPSLCAWLHCPPFP